ncbi:MAG: hypothetical protein ACREOK_16310 [Gemmatimonadaceae bacterium]
MAHDHDHKEFSCPACGAEFDTREQLEKHGKEKHQQSGQSTGGSASGNLAPEGRREPNS